MPSGFADNNRRLLKIEMRVIISIVSSLPFLRGLRLLQNRPCGRDKKESIKQGGRKEVGLSKTGGVAEVLKRKKIIYEKKIEKFNL